MLRKALVLGALLASASAYASKPEDYVGVWGVTMTATYSSCKNTNVGDVKSEEWNFNVESGKIKVVSQGGLGTDPKYEGELDPKTATLNLRNGTMTGLQLKGDTRNLRGSRVAARMQGAQPCAIIFEVKANRK